MLTEATVQLSAVIGFPKATAVNVVQEDTETFAGAEIVGLTLSITVTVCVAVAVLPLPSVTVHVTVVVPTA